MGNKGITIPLIILLVTGILLGIFVASRTKDTKNPVTEVTQKVAQVVTGGSGFNITSDTPGYENYLQLDTGCPTKDCIPAIDNPEFETVAEADTWLEDDDVVFALKYSSVLEATNPEMLPLIEYQDIVWAYPQRILNWHEIVNDHVKSDESDNVASTDSYVAITFCPLCGSALAFDRNVGDQLLTFGVSGKLHNNDLVMYDRETESLWQQITGEAIVGELFGTELTQISLTGMRWSEFKSQYPEGQSLSRNTGYQRDYDRYPYGSYEQDPDVNFSQEGGVDSTIFPKTVVYGVEVDGNFKAYSLEQIEELGVIFDKIGDVSVRIEYNGGDVEVVRSDIGTEIPATRLFWFAWKSFRPDTELY